MSAEGRKSTVKATVLANLFGLTERRIRQLAEVGVVVKAARGEFELASSIRAYVTFLNKTTGETDDSGTSFRRSRARLMAARAALAEMEQAEKSGLLIPSEQVNEAWTKITAIVRNRLLGIPSKMAARLAPISTPVAIEEALRTEINAALSEIAETPVRVTQPEESEHAER